MLKYAALFASDREAGGYVVTFPDFDYGVTQGDTLEEATDMAQDLLATLVADYMRRKVDLPAPRKHRGRNFRYVGLPALKDAKVALYVAMQEAGVRKAELARRLGCPKSSVDRLLDLDHASRLDQIEEAFRALGLELTIEIRNAA
jgi:antitoxin HicB